MSSGEGECLQVEILHKVLQRLQWSGRNNIAKRNMYIDFRFGSANLRLWRIRLQIPVHMVACGAEHTLLALMGGGVMGWGDNTFGQVSRSG